MADVLPVSPRFHDEQPAYLVPPITNFADGPSGLTHYPGTGFGDTLNDTFLLADFRGTPGNSGIRSFKLTPDGAFYKLGENAKPLWSILATDVAFGPDGALDISDWVNGWDGEGKGRIYRVSDPQHGQAEIVKEVQKLLAGNWSAVETAVSIPAVIMNLLAADAPVLRSAAVQFIGQHPAGFALEQLTELLADDSARVQYFAARAIGDAQYGEGFAAAVKMLAANDNRDPALRHGGMDPVAGQYLFFTKTELSYVRCHDTSWHCPQ